MLYIENVNDWNYFNVERSTRTVVFTVSGERR